MTKSLEDYKGEHDRRAGEVLEAISSGGDREEVQQLFDENIEQAKEAADINKHPEVFDEAARINDLLTATSKVTSLIEAGDLESARTAAKLLVIMLEQKKTAEKEKTPENKMLVEIKQMFTEEQMRLTVGQLYRYLEHGDDVTAIINIAAPLKLLNKEMFQENKKLERGLYAENYADSVSSLICGQYKELIRGKDILELGTSLKIAYPNIFDTILIPKLTKGNVDYWKDIVKSVEAESSVVPTFCLACYRAKIINPDKFEADLGETIVKNWGRIFEDLEQTRDDSVESGEIELFVEALHQAQFIKPEEEPDLQISKDTFEQFKMRLHKFIKEENLVKFLRFAHCVSNLKLVE